ncbi:unnamed protein product [Protopolystoma xenopodis]|uniref:Uncharacterized protein n=1 Tax=Protopolystoma xenopodis TaxID=117903 RepID=A0A448XJ85_9PLAT|nr:unnamed protein product [Protopolystoma xenopodis]
MKYLGILKEARERNLVERHAEWVLNCEKARAQKLEELKARQEAEAKRAEEASEALLARAAEDEVAAKERERERRTLGFGDRQTGDINGMLGPDGLPLRRGFQRGMEIEAKRSEC